MHALILFVLSREPKWADVTHGVIVCTECSGIHRRLQPTPTVKSTGFGKWEPAHVQVPFMCSAAARG